MDWGISVSWRLFIIIVLLVITWIFYKVRFLSFIHYRMQMIFLGTILGINTVSLQVTKIFIYDFVVTAQTFINLHLFLLQVHDRTFTTASTK